MRVLLVNSVFGYASTGTIVRNIQFLCEQRGIECYVAYSYSNLSEGQIHNGYKIGSKWEKKLHALLCRINGKQAYFSHFATYRFIRYIKNVKPNVVHLHTIHGNYLNMPMLLRFLAKHKIRTIVTMHDCWYYTGGCFHYTQANCFRWQQKCGSCPKKRMDTPAFFLDLSHQILLDKKRLFDAIPNLIVTGVSDWVCQESLKGIFRDKYVVTIHNGIDTSIFRPVEYEKVALSKEILQLKNELYGHFVIMGLAGKWLDTINRQAFEYILKQMGEKDRFLLFGCNKALLKCFNSMNIPLEAKRKVVTWGYTNNQQQLAVLYNIADVFINCTREDSFSLINIEPQACGTPVVTFANTGAKETVNNQCSFSVPTGDFQSMWQKILLIHKNCKRKYTYDCINWVYENFNMQKNYQKYLDLYK